jgi:MscS family membrane protein
MPRLPVRPASALSALVAAAPCAALAQVPATPAPAAARPFFEAHLPSALVQLGPHGLLWWQWLALPALLALGVAVGWLLGYLTRAVLAHITARTQNTWDDLLIDRIAGPLTALWAVAFVTVTHPWLSLGPGAEAVLERVLRACTYLSLFWAGFRLVDIGFSALGAAPWTRGNAGLTGLLPLGRKVAKVVLLSIGAVAVLNELGFQVASLLAGLGIGGIALALAAQKTVEHLFGSVAIGVDQPFRVGDMVKIEDVQGWVESIGMRSTRIRTLDRTLVTFPNGKLAETRSENLQSRDRFRLQTSLALSYGTTAAQMRAVLSAIEAALRGHPRIAADVPLVRFTEFRESALHVEVMAWFATTDGQEFNALRQELYLRFLEIVEQAGASFAFPTRTVRLEPGAPAKAEGPGEVARAPR